MLAPANDAEILGVLRQASRELAVRELMIHDDLIHGQGKGPRKALDELPVLAFVGMPEKIPPQGVGHGPDLLVRSLDDVQAESFSAGVWLLVVVTLSSATR